MKRYRFLWKEYERGIVRKTIDAEFSTDADATGAAQLVSYDLDSAFRLEVQRLDDETTPATPRWEFLTEVWP